MKIWELDTPALLIDRDILLRNLRRMQEFADARHVGLRPHTKTHKMPYIAELQRRLGAIGIAVAKVGEAEVMAENGLDEILIANEIVGREKLQRIAELTDRCHVVFGVDSTVNIQEAEAVFSAVKKRADVAVEIEVGENRSGIIRESAFRELLQEIKRSPHVNYRGVFGHDGNGYRAQDQEACRAISRGAQERLLRFASIAGEEGFERGMVSYGSTPALLCGSDILDGITDLRVGTYALMDASQAHVLGTYEHCAAYVLATVMSLPTRERVILDVGAKGLTMQERQEGICASEGKGRILEDTSVRIEAVFDEHAIIHNEAFGRTVKIGDKVRIIPAHICPVCNLYDTAYLCSGTDVVGEIPVLCRGKLQ